MYTNTVCAYRCKAVWNSERRICSENSENSSCIKYNYVKFNKRYPSLKASITQVTKRHSEGKKNQGACMQLYGTFRSGLLEGFLPR